MNRQSGLTCPALSSLLHLFFGVSIVGGGELWRHGAVQVVDGWQQSFSVKEEVQRGKLHLKYQQGNIIQIYFKKFICSLWTAAVELNVNLGLDLILYTFLNIWW